MRTRFKLFFFFQYLAVGVMGPYFALFLYQRDYAGTQLGLLLGSMPLAVMAFQPVWSYLSDILNMRRNILVIGFIGMAVCVGAIGLVEPFWQVFVLSILLAIFRAPLHPVSTAIVLDYLEEKGTTLDYSRFRLWGSIAFSISSLILGFVYSDRLVVYFPIVVSVLYILSAISSLFLPESKKEFHYARLEGVSFLKENKVFGLYLLGSIFIGASLSIVMNYQSIFLEFLESPGWLLGIVVASQAIFEVPLMLITPKLMRTFSWKTLILIGAFSLPFRWLVYIFIKNPIWALPTQLLHAIAIVSFMVVGVSFIDKWISQKWRATSQGLLSTAMGGLGSGIGQFLAGGVMDGLGIRFVWVLNLTIGILACFMLVYALKKIENRTTVEEV